MTVCTWFVDTSNYLLCLALLQAVVLVLGSDCCANLGFLPRPASVSRVSGSSSSLLRAFSCLPQSRLQVASHCSHIKQIASSIGSLPQGHDLASMQAPRDRGPSRRDEPGGRRPMRDRLGPGIADERDLPPRELLERDLPPPPARGPGGRSGPPPARGFTPPRGAPFRGPGMEGPPFDERGMVPFDDPRPGKAPGDGKALDSRDSSLCTF
jgi:hypothetical protein